MLIIFEGMDKSGKTTLLNELNKQTNFEHIVLDRGVISSYVYNKIYGRAQRQKYDFFVDMIKDVPHVIFFCIAGRMTIMQRLKDANETLDEYQEKLGINEIQKLFFEESLNVMDKGLNINILHTDFDIKDILRVILHDIEKVEAGESKCLKE